MAKVTLAQDTVLGRPVALKRVYASGDSRDVLRLKREALVGASLNHPNLVFVYDARLEGDGDVVIVMEYVEGETLADVISSRGGLPPGETLRILRDVGAALDAIHQQGIIHRDVKPANVLLGRDGTVKLADLGVADVADRTHITSAGAVVGSFSYMAAEQLDGAEPSPAMDVYALAAVAFEMLTGEKARPESNPLALAHAISTQPPPDLRAEWPEAPAEVAAVLKRALEADPARRPHSAGELVRRLESAFTPAPATEATPGRAPRRAAGVMPAADRPPPAGERPQTSADRPPRSRMVPALLALTAIVVAGAVVAILTSSGGAKKPTAANRSASAPQRSAHRPSATTGTRSTATGTRSTATSTRSTPTSTGSPATTASSTPAAAVEQFYTDAAAHRYPAAWALADQSLRNELGGYTAFQSLMSSVRSITFHRAQVLPGSSPGTATVSVDTTSVQTGKTQRCSGTAQTMRAGTGWVVGAVSISCG